MQQRYGDYRALSRYQQAYDRDIVQGCFQAAVKASKPLEAAIWVTAAQILQHYLETDELACIAQMVISNCCPPDACVLDEQALAEKDALANLLIKLRRELDRDK